MSRPRSRLSLVAIALLGAAATVMSLGSSPFAAPLAPSALFETLAQLPVPGSAPQTGGDDPFEVRRPRVRAALAYGPIDGISLGLFSQDPSYDYLPLLKEIKRTGARWVSFTTNNYVEKVSSTDIGIADSRTVTSARLRTTIRQARSLGLYVMLFPILLIQKPEDNEWRGTLAPAESAVWFKNYQRWMGEIAQLCQEESVEMLSIGSEFNSLQGERDAWLSILTDVRSRYRGLVTYSANWDSLDGVSFIEQLDIIGMTTYFSLSDENDPTVDQMTEAWRKVQRDIAEWRVFHQIPLLFTEVGYPSQDGANQNPWNYYTSEVPDLGEQRDCYEAFYRVWGKDQRVVQGVYFYNWFGVGGPKDTGYTPRGKPALDVIQRWFQGSRSQRKVPPLSPATSEPPKTGSRPASGEKATDGR